MIQHCDFTPHSEPFLQTPCCFKTAPQPTMDVLLLSYNTQTGRQTGQTTVPSALTANTYTLLGSARATNRACYRINYLLKVSSSCETQSRRHL